MASSEDSARRLLGPNTPLRLHSRKSRLLSRLFFIKTFPLRKRTGMAAKIPVYTREEVFIVGGQPTVTYNPRPTQGFDTRLRDYVMEANRILCITGPTKSGKTVLARSVLPQSIRISGGEIRSIDEFWQDLADELNAFTDEIIEESDTSAGMQSDTLAGSAKIFGVGGEVSRTQAQELGKTVKRAMSRSRNPRKAAKDALKGTKLPVVIDDFHHVEPSLQKQIVHGVKDSVSLGVPVVVIAVPHHAAAVVRGEREMAGRVEHLQIPPWTREELEDIAGRGFSALNIDFGDAPAAFAKESYGSPHLMQDFCLRVCKHMDISETVGEPFEVSFSDRKEFFRWIAGASGQANAYDMLAGGPRQRSDRIARKLKTGEVTDIYGAVLRAVASTGPKIELDWTEIRTGLKQVLADEPPRRHEYTRVLEKMSEIAKGMVWEDEHQRYAGDPIIEYDAKLGKLHISDPFFAFQLRWEVRK